MPRDIKQRIGQIFMTPSQLALAGAREDAERKAEMIKEERARQEASKMDFSIGGDSFRLPQEDVAKFRMDQALKQAGRGQMPPGMKLGVDQRWNPTTESAEIIPGSKTDMAQKDKWAKDAALMRGVKTQGAEGIEKINYILDPTNKSGFEGQFGGYNALLTRKMSGNTADVGAKIGALKSSLAMAGKQLMGQGGAIGQITEREWPKLEGMIAALDATMTEQGAREALELIKNKFESMQREAEQAYQSEWSGSRYDQQNQPQQAPQDIDPERAELEARRAARQRR